MAFRIKIKNGYYNFYIYIILSSMNFIVTMEKTDEENKVFRSINYMKEDFPFDYDLATQLMIPYSLLNKSLIESLKNTPKFNKNKLKLKLNKNKHFYNEYKKGNKKNLMINVYNITYGKMEDEAKKDKEPTILPIWETTPPKIYFTLSENELETKRCDEHEQGPEQEPENEHEYPTCEPKTEHHQDCTTTEIGSFILRYKAPSTTKTVMTWNKTNLIKVKLEKHRKGMEISKNMQNTPPQTNFRIFYVPFKNNTFEKNFKKYMDSAKDLQRWPIIEQIPQPMVKLNYTKNKQLLF
ncbi:hypothetical protein O3M35_008201 [Rhynocoris fuscipes]|uniref:Uncharacterized protein n=1 Tax=Rhynocoris fuscipes TaxID=488301 RepID=A0AAW1D6R0_9HEMI